MNFLLDKVDSQIGMAIGKAARTAASLFSSKRDLTFLLVIVAVASSLATLVYIYYSFSSNEINNIASQDIRSNARIEAYDFARILENEIDTIRTSLGIIADSPAVQNDEKLAARALFDSAQNNSESWVDFFAWLSADGKLIWSSNINETTYQKYNGTDLSFRPYFIVPKSTHEPYYSSVIESVDNVPRVFVSLPIMSNDLNQSGNSIIGNLDNNTKTETNPNPESNNQQQVFKGIVYSGIRLDTVGDLLKDQLIPEFQSSVSLLDRNGTILYSQNQSFIGQNVFSNEIQSLIYRFMTPESKDKFNDILRSSLVGKEGSEDIKISGQISTVSYQPVIIGTNQKNNNSSNHENNYFMSLYVVSPHLLASNVGALIDQQRNFSIIIVIVISALALGIAFLVITWNKRLRTTVNTKTAELKGANEQLKAHDKMQREFINIAAHELRTPTQAVLGYSEILKKLSREENRHNEMIDAIHRNATRLQRLANDILDVTRIESKTLKLRKERFNLNDALSHVVNDYKNEINKNNSQISISYEPAIEPGNRWPLIVADKERVIQVVSNLINNAIKFTTQGTISVSAKIIRENEEMSTKNKGRRTPEDRMMGTDKEILRLDDGQVLVSIKDTGSGIDSEIVPKLFSKFTTKSLKGTGLGLFISKSIVEAHGGKIWADNNDRCDGDYLHSRNDNEDLGGLKESGDERRGATFNFTLPLNDGYNMVSTNDEDKR
jgi:signal transduction histidine kinase